MNNNKYQDLNKYRNNYKCKKNKNKNKKNKKSKRILSFREVVS